MLCLVSAIAASGALPIHAQPPAANGADVARKAGETAERGFVWEASKGRHRVLLVGTIHVGRAETALTSMNCARRYAEAEVIAFEADVFDAQKVGALIQRMAMYAPGEPDLTSRIPAQLRERIEALLPRYGVEPAALWRMKPWMLANTLVVIEASRLGFSPAHATEAFLYQFAKTCGKSIVEIEGIERQLGIFERASAELQVAYLDQAVRGIESGEGEHEMRRLVTAWEKRDSADMERLLATMRASSGAAERFVVGQVIDARHPQMIEAIERFAASGRLHLVAVGSLHYFGPNGLLELLRRRDYTITALN
jgi:uncharacterized protein YbaP (TraB family)